MLCQMRFNRRVACAFVMLFAAAHPLAAQETKTSWAELKAAGTELKSAQFESIYGTPLDPKSADLARVSTSVLKRVEDFRRQAIDSQTVGPPDPRSYVLKQGLLVGTAIIAPTMGLPAAQTIRAVSDGTLIPRLLNEAQQDYQNNTVALIGATLNATGDLDKLRAASKDPNTSSDQLKQQAIDFWGNAQPLLSKQLSDLSPDEQKAVFDKGAKALVDVLDKYDPKAPIGNAVKAVIAVRSELSKIDEKHRALAKQFDDYVGNVQEQQKAGAGAGAGLRNLESNAQWRQLGARQRIAALKAGWFPALSPAERESQIEKLDVAAKIETVGSSVGLASDYAGALLVAAKALNVSPDIQNAIVNAKKNIDTAQTALGIAAQIAMGNYLGALGSFGGLLGGGGAGGAGGSDTGQAAIMAALHEINQKLDKIIELQKQTLEEVRGLRDQVQEFAIATNRRFNSIDANNFETISRLMQLRWQIEGSLKCQSLLQELVDHPTAREYDFSKHSFVTYQARLNYFRGEKAADFAGCRGFFSKALTLDTNGEVSDYFQLRPERQTLEALRQQAPPDLANRSLDFLLAHTLYFGMQAYYQDYLDSLKAIAKDASKCDAALFHSLSNTPLRLTDYLSADRSDCFAAYKLGSGRPAPVFTVMTAHQLDLYVLNNFANMLEMFTPFRLFENKEGTGLRPVEELQQTNAVALTDLRLQYSGFSDVLAAASAQQAMISGSVVAPYAADQLTSYDFGRVHISCPGFLDNEQNAYDAAKCAVAKKMDQYAVQLEAANRQLSVANDDASTQSAERVLGELRAKIAGELAEQETPIEKRTLVGTIFSMVQILNQHNCMKLTDAELKEAYPTAHLADKNVVDVLKKLMSDATTPEGRAFWNHARLVCLMQRNSEFAENIVKVVVLQDKKKNRWSNFGYTAAVLSQGNDVLMKTVLKTLPYAWVHTTISGTWRIEVHDVYGWIDTYNLPLTTDMDDPVSSETDAHRLISNLRNRAVSKLAELSVCSDEKGSCSDDEMRLIRRVAIGLEAR